MREIALRCIGVSKRFDTTEAVEALTLNLERGAILALVGPSGCGKTTTLRLIAGFEQPDSGAIILGGRTIAGRGIFVPPEQRRVGVVFQEYALFPHLSVAQNIAFGLAGGTTRNARETRVAELIKLVGLEALAHRHPHELSGGEQQRVALARALAPSPHVLLMDEPFSSLHANLRVQVRAEVKEILRASGTTAVLVTHDQEEALVMGDLVAIQRAGRLEQVDTPEAIFHAPATRFVASFMGMADFLPLHGVTEQEAGQPAIPTQAHAEPGPTPVELMVRPDDLLLVGNDVGNGVVTARTFQGPTYLYEVTLPHGNRVRCSTSHTERFAVGSRVSVRIHPDHPPLCFVNGRLVGAASRALIARLERDVLDTTG